MLDFKFRYYGNQNQHKCLSLKKTKGLLFKQKCFKKIIRNSTVEYPVSFRSIKRFESRNQILINVLGVEGKQMYILRKGGDYNRFANLMLITEGNHKHYVAIKSLCRLLSKKNNKSNGAQHFCTNCLQGFREEQSRDEHVHYCCDNEAVQIEMPHCNPIVKF